MSALFGLLFFLSIIGLVIALIRPKIFSGLLKHKSNRRHLSYGFGFLVLLFLILGAVTTPQKTQLQASNTKATLANNAKSNVTTKTTTSTQSIPFTTSTEQNSSLAQGTNQVKVQGVDGSETLTYKVTYTNGKQTGNDLVSTTITTPPINEVIDQGTYVAPKVTPNPAPTTPAPQAPTSPTQSCYPLTNGGNCYEPGEYCRIVDHGTSGVAGDGKSITCENNNGWRWEPS